MRQWMGRRKQRISQTNEKEELTKETEKEQPKRQEVKWKNTLSQHPGQRVFEEGGF